MYGLLVTEMKNEEMSDSTGGLTKCIQRMLLARPLPVNQRCQCTGANELLNVIFCNLSAVLYFAVVQALLHPSRTGLIYSPNSVAVCLIIPARVSHHSHRGRFTNRECICRLQLVSSLVDNH